MLALLDKTGSFLFDWLEILFVHLAGSFQFLEIAGDTDQELILTAGNIKYVIWA